ncbi:MAG: lasso peptide biosynthesis B2 protein [Methylococcaceae bacterium]|nr:lasso peptide biosynthesis B2 protein [Methylococcaceae bacterium]
MDYPRKIQKFLISSPADRKLFIQATLLLVLMRVALAWIRFQALWRLLKRMGLVESQTPQRPSLYLPPEQIARALARASRCLPGTSCLPHALAGAVMLNRQGYPANLCIGVAKENDEFGAHAWVECEGRAVIGSKAHFNTLLILPGATS